MAIVARMKLVRQMVSAAEKSDQQFGEELAKVASIDSADSPRLIATLTKALAGKRIAGRVAAARALGQSDRGIIAAGMRADLAIWDVHSAAELSYGIGINPLHKRIFGGAL